jgi:hypothetical protein
MLAWLPNLLYVCGVFGVILGALHFFFPLLFDFRGAIAREGDALKPFPLLVTNYNTSRGDIYGLVWVMNGAASFAILTVGLLDLFWQVWLYSDYGTLIAIWIALFYFIRAGSQVAMGTRRGDWLILGAFATLGAFHLLVLVI